MLNSITKVFNNILNKQNHVEIKEKLLVILSRQKANRKVTQKYVLLGAHIELFDEAYNLLQVPENYLFFVICSSLAHIHSILRVWRGEFQKHLRFGKVEFPYSQESQSVRRCYSYSYLIKMRLFVQTVLAALWPVVKTFFLICVQY